MNPVTLLALGYLVNLLLLLQMTVHLKQQLQLTAQMHQQPTTPQPQPHRVRQQQRLQQLHPAVQLFVCF